MKYLMLLLLTISILGCTKEGLSDENIPIPSRNAKLNVIVELCTVEGCEPLSGKVVNIYEYEDEAMGNVAGIRLMTTDTSGVANFGLIELTEAYVTVRNNGILDISRVSLPRNSISHHLVTFSM